MIRYAYSVIWFSANYHFRWFVFGSVLVCKIFFISQWAEENNFIWNLSWGYPIQGWLTNIFINGFWVPWRRVSRTAITTGLYLQKVPQKKVKRRNKELRSRVIRYPEWSAFLARSLFNTVYPPDSFRWDFQYS